MIFTVRCEWKEDIGFHLIWLFVGSKILILGQISKFNPLLIVYDIFIYSHVGQVKFGLVNLLTLEVFRIDPDYGSFSSYIVESIHSI